MIMSFRAFNGQLERILRELKVRPTAVKSVLVFRPSIVGYLNARTSLLRILVEIDIRSSIESVMSGRLCFRVIVVMHVGKAGRP